jgi:hypothetical protein
MPTNVRRFEILIYLAGIITVATTPLRGISLTPPQILENVIWWGFIILLIWLTARRKKNWARWLLFGLFVMETITIPFIVVSHQEGALGLLILLSVSVIEGAAYYFVFNGDSRPWFRGASQASGAIVS